MSGKVIRGEHAKSARTHRLRRMRRLSVQKKRSEKDRHPGSRSDSRSREDENGAAVAVALPPDR